MGMLLGPSEPNFGRCYSKNDDCLQHMKGQRLLTVDQPIDFLESFKWVHLAAKLIMIM